jgi:DNA-binding MarR family transcriptional regulator
MKEGCFKPRTGAVMPEQVVNEKDQAVDMVDQKPTEEDLLVLNVGDDGSWRVLGSPYRMRLYETIRRMRECTISELAAHANTKPVNLYYHLRSLENTGLVQPIGRREGVARRAPVLYGTVHKRIEIEFDPMNDEHQERMNTIRRSWQREANDSIETGVRFQEQGKPGRFMVHFRWESLSTGEQDEISRHFREIIEILDRPRDSREPVQDDSSLLHIGLQMVEHFEPRLPAPQVQSRPRTADDSRV